MSWTNVKEELFGDKTVDQIQKEIKCITIQHGYYEPQAVYYNLKLGYTKKQLVTFLALIENIHYDSGFGGQELFGIVWLKDGTWLERGEYDGSEWWEHRVVPDVLEELK